jgi:hypothetical protein
MTKTDNGFDFEVLTLHANFLRKHLRLFFQQIAPIDVLEQIVSFSVGQYPSGELIQLFCDFIWNFGKSEILTFDGENYPVGGSPSKNIHVTKVACQFFVKQNYSPLIRGALDSLLIA